MITAEERGVVADALLRHPACPTIYLQRILKIGYTQARQLIEEYAGGE